MSTKVRTRKKRRTNPLFIVLMGIALVLAASWTYQLVELDSTMEKRKADVLQQKTYLTAENEKLRKDIEMLNTPSYIEQLAREKLGLARKGEIIVAPKQVN